MDYVLNRQRRVLFDYDYAIGLIKSYFCQISPIRIANTTIVIRCSQDEIEMQVIRVLMRIVVYQQRVYSDNWKY